MDPCIRFKLQLPRERNEPFQSLLLIFQKKIKSSAFSVGNTFAYRLRSMWLYILKKHAKSRLQRLPKILVEAVCQSLYPFLIICHTENSCWCILFYICFQDDV